VGAGIDSFFEYLAKAYILLGDDEYYRIWTEAYEAVMKNLRSNDGFWVGLGWVLGLFRLFLTVNN
jgi:mannosidase alpha-like ER degradation enhancer 1